MRPALSRKLDGFGTTIFTEMTRLANEHGAINLSQGFPDFDGPEFAREAAVAAIRAGFGQYARMTGIPEIHRALSAKYRRDWGLEYAADTELTVTSGATEAIFSAIQGVCDAGDEVVLFEPYYDSYKASVAMAGAVPRVVTLHAPDWTFDPRELEAAFSAKTRVLLLNTPHNPTGKVFSRDELETLAALCRRSRRALHHRRGLRAPRLRGPPRADGHAAGHAGAHDHDLVVREDILPDGLEDRLGGGAAGSDGRRARGPPVRHVRHRHAAAARRGLGARGRSGVLRRLSSPITTARRDYLSRELARLGFELRPPQGTYFVCADFRRFGFDDDRAFVRHMIEKAGVAAIPPSVFYDHPEEGRRYVRFAFCKKRETLEAAVARLEKLCD